MMRKHISCFLFLLVLVQNLSFGQALRGTTGLLHAPSAEMQTEGTFMVGANVLALEPLHYMYTDEITHTYNYFFNLTFFSWLEIGYTCTLNYANHGSLYFPDFVWGTYSNQDRSFYARIRPWKEGQWFNWMPAFVIGLDDPMSHTQYGGGSITITDASMSDNHFTRYYAALSKHFTLSGIGTLGLHLSWCDIYGTGSTIVGRQVEFEHIQRPALGVDLRFDSLPDNLAFLHNLDWIIEYDARTVNTGFYYSLFDGKLNFVLELNNFKYLSGGLFFRVNLL